MSLAPLHIVIIVGKWMHPMLKWLPSHLNLEHVLHREMNQDFLAKTWLWWLWCTNMLHKQSRVTQGQWLVRYRNHNSNRVSANQVEWSCATHLFYNAYGQVCLNCILQTENLWQEIRSSKNDPAQHANHCTPCTNVSMCAASACEAWLVRFGCQIDAYAVHWCNAQMHDIEVVL